MNVSNIVLMIILISQNNMFNSIHRFTSSVGVPNDKNVYNTYKTIKNTFNIYL